MHLSVPLPEFPERPGAVPSEASASAVLDAYERHLFVLVAARAGSPPMRPARLVQHVVAALALGQALVDDVTAGRWPLLRDGLAGGATRAQLGAAPGGLDVDELAAGLTSWADREHREGRLTDVEWIDVRDLATGGAR